MAALAATACLLGLGGATASADQVELTVDDAWLFVPPLGPAALQHSIGPGDDPLVLTGQLAADGSFTIPGSQFALPEIPAPPPVPGGALFEPDGDITGNFDRSNGQMTAEVPLRITVSATMTPPPPDQPGTVSCRFTGFAAQMSTDGEFAWEGIELRGGPFESDGEGALLGGWSMTAAEFAAHAQALDGTPMEACGQMATSLPGGMFSGELWLGGQAKVLEATCPQGQVGTPPDCAPSPPACPVGTPPECEARPEIGALALKPAKAKIGAGESKRLRLRIRNVGDAAGKVKVRIESSNRRVKPPRSLTIRVPARSTVLTGFKAKATKKARGKARITASALGAKAAATLTVKKAKRKRR